MSQTQKFNIYCESGKYFGAFLLKTHQDKNINYVGLDDIHDIIGKNNLISVQDNNGNVVELLGTGPSSNYESVPDHFKLIVRNGTIIFNKQILL